MKGRIWGVAVAAVLLLTVPSAMGSDTPPPTGVTIAGSLQSELGCAGDWDPACAATGLAYDAGDDAWQATFSLPAGSFEYKAALNGSWTENYGAHAVRDGANIALSLAAPRSVTFLYDHETHWVTDSVTSTIVTAPGSFQSELGCPGDWDPGCLRSWLQDPDGDGRYTMSTTALPPGSYEVKAAINQSWDENYGQGGDAERREHRVLGGARRLDGRVLLRRLDARAHRLGDAAGRRGARRQRRVGRPAPRLARPPLPHPRRRGAGRNAGEAPPSHVPRRRHERAGARVRRERERAAAADDAPRGRGRVLLPGRPRQPDVRLLRGRAPERARRTTSGTGSSSRTGPTPTTTATTRPRSTAASAPPPTTSRTAAGP